MLGVALRSGRDVRKSSCLGGEEEKGKVCVVLVVLVVILVGDMMRWVL